MFNLHPKAVVCAVVVVAGLPLASTAQVTFNVPSTNTTGFANGNATPNPGSGVPAVPGYNQSPTSSTSATMSSGGTSGGLGDGPGFKAGFAALTLSATISPLTTARAPNQFDIVFKMDGNARFDTADYSGSIEANLSMSGTLNIFASLAADGDAGVRGTAIPYFLLFGGGPLGNFTLTGPGGAVQPGAGMLFPGQYSFSFSGRVAKGSEGDSIPGVLGIARLTIPAPGASGAVALGAMGVLVGARRRRAA